MSRAVRGRQHPLVGRFGAIAIASLLVTCTLLAQWHEATVVHVRCAVHGELMHVASENDSGVRTATTPIGEHRFAPHSGDSGSEDDHCLLGAIHTSIATPSGLGAMTDDAALVAIATMTPSQLIARATYRLAPKTSPPL